MGEEAGRDLPSSPLAYRDYRELWAANMASNFGSQVQVVGAGWLMASLTSSPQLIALVQTATNLPTVFFILAGGALADTISRRGIMLTMQSAMLLSALLLAVLSWRDLVSPWSLMALTFVISGLGSFSNPSWQASVRDILPRTLISRAVALNSMSINLARTAGPAMGGVIVLAGGVAAAFLANALSFLGFLIALLRWKPRPSVRTGPRERLLPAMMAGVRYAVHAPHVRNCVLRGGLSGLSASAMFALLPVVARQRMEGTALTYGLLLAAFGGGAVVSAWIAGRLRGRLTPDQVILIAAASMATGLVLLALAPTPPLAAIGAALGGSGWTMAHSTFNTTVQLAASSWVTARALAFYQTTTFAGMAAGSVMFGWVAEHQGAGIALLAAGLLHATSGIAGQLLLPLPRFQDLRTEPLNRWQAPALDNPIDPNEGPVRVELHYRIAPEQRAAFLSAMDVRGQIRRRDGARNWALWQDIADPERWVESYRVADWGEYLRHNSRRTEADRDNADTIDRLNAAPGGPVIHRYLGHRH